MAVKESTIQTAIRLELGRVEGLVLWRNNSGMAMLSGGHRVRFGVGDGGADLIGIYRGRFLAAEIKSASGRSSAKQKRFGELVRRLGGEHVVLRSVEDARVWLTELRRRYG